MSRPKKRVTHDIYTYEDGNTVRRMEAAPDYQEERRRRKEERRISEQKRRRRRAARRNRERALKMSAGYVAFLSACVAAAAFLFVVYVRLQSNLMIRQERIGALEREVSEMKEDNDAVYKRITNSVNLKEIKKQAKKFGMKYPSKDQIIYYSIENSDYMTQYAD